MAIAYDAASQSTRSGASSKTWSHTCTGSNLVLFVGAGAEWFGVTMSSVTYATVALTQLWNAGFGTFYGHSGHYLKAPATGANNVVATMSGAADILACGAISLSGVDQTTTVGTPVTATGGGTSASVTVTGVNSTDMLVDNLSVNSISDSVVVGANQTQRYRSGAAAESGAIGSTQSGADGGVMSWTETFTGMGWGLGAVAFLEAGGGGGVTVKSLAALGVG